MQTMQYVLYLLKDYSLFLTCFIKQLQYRVKGPETGLILLALQPSPGKWIQ